MVDVGMMQHYHHAEFTPRFCKQYAIVGHEIQVIIWLSSSVVFLFIALQNGLAKYKEEVHNGVFPDDSFSPYKISDKENELFEKHLEEFKKQQAKVEDKADLETKTEDSENIKVY